MQKGAGPNAAMDKANRNKMFLQGEGAVRKGQADEKQHKNVYGNCLGGNPDPPKNYGCGGRDKPIRVYRVKHHIRFQQEGNRGH